MKTLKDAGVGRTTWENNVEAEVEDFVQTLEEQGGKPYDVLESLSASVSNNITSIILGKRLLKGDPRRKKVDDGINAAIATFSGFDLVSFFPKIVRLLAIFGLSKHTDTFQRLSTFHNFVRSEMERRQKIPASEWNEEIFIDGYLTEIQKVQQKSAETFSTALMIGGSDTSRTFLIWLFIAMALYPDIQKKVQKEVDTVLGKDGKMMWSERSKVPFLYATMLETHRWKTVTPLGVIHSVSEDTVICGYDIPKGTNILPNQYAMHNDPKYWKDPEVFRPERFLNKDGSLISHKLDSYVPFSIGRRICPGEMIAMIEIFHYFTAIMQRFDIRPLEGVPPILEGSFGATFQPMEQKLRFIPRA
ncbi:vitamin D 25-hydroxylase [Caerostris extrusa]|uniref:Vitamin D 25-hydroxylase n=1 Tax=Caerostris extrusa TaxID=172846 RepID=A0AAV4M8I8_CAEEX|nr:vitamin D 25-hydroxylase [Caerostris extrusa]